MICSSCRFHAPLNIKVNDIILIQVLFEICTFTDFQSGKNRFRITAPAVIGCQHIRGNGLSKAPWAAVANVPLQCIQNSVCILNKPGFININFRIQSNLKCGIVRIYKHSHVSIHSLPKQYSQKQITLCKVIPFQDTLILSSNTVNIKLITHIVISMYEKVRLSLYPMNPMVRWYSARCGTSPKSSAVR